MCSGQARRQKPLHKTADVFVLEFLANGEARSVLADVGCGESCRNTYYSEKHHLSARIKCCRWICGEFNHKYVCTSVCFQYWWTFARIRGGLANLHLPGLTNIRRSEAGSQPCV